MDSVPVWAVIIVLGIVGSLATWLWRGTDKRLDKHAEKLDDHDKRITRLEEKNDHNSAEVQKLRDRWHDLTNEVSHTLAQWFNELVKMIKGEK